MPTYYFKCEVCGQPKKAWRAEDVTPPRFCSDECRIRGFAGKSLKPIKYPITSEIHEMIKRIYQTSTGNGEVKALAKKLGYPRCRIGRYAINQGWIAKQKKEPLWTENELRILERNAHLSPERIQLKLKDNGFRRTCTGIVLKRKRLNLLSSLNGQSACSLAECLGVDAHFVTRAIKEGRLKAQMRDILRTEKQGGDMYYIKDKHVRDYLIDNIHEIDLRKVDKWWFTDMLAGGYYGLSMRGHPL